MAMETHRSSSSLQASEHESVTADPSVLHCTALMLSSERFLPQAAQSCVVLSSHGPAHAYSKLQMHSAVTPR